MNIRKLTDDLQKSISGEELSDEEKLDLVQDVIDDLKLSLEYRKNQAPATCPNCDKDMPLGCNGRFKNDDGKACWLNLPESEIFGGSNE